MTTTAIDRFSPAYRSTHLGASQWPAACGLDPYQDTIELYARFTGLRPWDDEDAPQDAIELGHALEAGVAKVAARKLGLGIQGCPTLEHWGLDFLCATPDRVLSNGEILQVKTTRLTNPGHVFKEEWGEEGTDEVPPRVLTQVMGEMFVSRGNLAGMMFRDPLRCHVAALIPGRGVAMFVVDWDEELAGMFVGRIRKFWGHVKDRKPPSIDDTVAFAQFIGQRFPLSTAGDWVEADAAVEIAAGTYRAVHEQIAELEKAERLAKTTVCAAIGDAEGIRGTFGKITWRSVKGREQVRLEAVIEELRNTLGRDVVDPIISKHTHRGPGHRRFTPTWTTENT